jgi:signal peptidase II
VIILDQLTKIWATQTLTFNQPIAILPFFNFTLLHNTGAAFSFLANAGGWQRWFFTILAIGVSFVLVLWLARLKSNQYGLASALALILGGALGNVIDRLNYGYVIDFLDFYYKTWHWPAFNIADSAITIGAAILIVDAFRTTK